MAGVKETPRQKMIGMMYLVLTAMLALNVSAEVLDAFNIMDKGLNQSVTTIREKNNADLAALARDTTAKAKLSNVNAIVVRTKTSELYNYIDTLKVKIIKATDGEDALALEGNTIDSDKIDGKSDTDTGTKILLGENQNGEAYVLRKKIEAHRNFLLSLVSDNNSPTVQAIQNLLQTNDPSTAADGTNMTWETAMFESMPVASDIAMLSLFQLNLITCEGELLNYLLKEINKHDYKFSKIEAKVVPSSNYVIKGTEFSAEIFLTAHDPSLRPTFRMGGRTLEADSEGKIIYKIQPQTVGAMSIKGDIIFPSPDGGMTTLAINHPFQVVEPQVVVSPTKMNVVYRGIENPLSISLSGVATERLKASASSGNIIPRGNEFILVPGNGNTCVVSVSLDGKEMGGFTFRVKNVPVPTPVIHGITSKTVSKGEMLAAQGLRAEMKDFEFELQYRITSFTLSATIDGYLEEARSNSQIITEQQKQILNRVKSGSRVAFTDIKAIGPDGRTVDLLDLSVRIN